MKIAITGGAGFIGSCLARAYLDAGHDVLLIDNLSCGTRQAIDERARFYEVDIRDNKLRAILEQERPDLVSHHVAYQHDTSMREESLADADVHIRGLLNILESCVSAAVSKIIFASNGNDLYGHIDADQLPVTEDTPLSPIHLDDTSKVAGEWYVRYYTQRFGLKHTILRYADVYGETDNTHAHHPLTYFIAMLQQQRRPIIRGTGNDARDQIFIDDIVQANICALKQGDNETLHISSMHGYSPSQLCTMVALLLKSDLEPVYISGTLAEDCKIVLDNNRAYLELGWTPEVAMMEGIRRMLEGGHTRKEYVPAHREVVPNNKVPTPAIF